jgi:hypothetical protein
MAASRYDRDEFHRLDVELIVGAVVKLEVLPWGGRADSPHEPDRLSSTHKKSLREIADFKEPKSAPAGVENSEHQWLKCYLSGSCVITFFVITYGMSDFERQEKAVSNSWTVNCTKKSGRWLAFGGTSNDTQISG